MITNLYEARGGWCWQVSPAGSAVILESVRSFPTAKAASDDYKAIRKQVIGCYLYNGRR